MEMFWRVATDSTDLGSASIGPRLALSGENQFQAPGSARSGRAQRGPFSVKGRGQSGIRRRRVLQFSQLDASPDESVMSRIGDIGARR